MYVLQFSEIEITTANCYQSSNLLNGDKLENYLLTIHIVDFCSPYILL